MRNSGASPVACGAFQRLGQPVASIDTKKKELVGRYRNGGREWRPKGQPEEVKVHDFIDRELGKAIPYGVYDLTANTGWVSVGVDHDTAESSPWRRFGAGGCKWGVRRIRRPRDCCSRPTGAVQTAGRSRLWKFELQKLADGAGVTDLGVPLSAGDQQVEQDRGTGCSATSRRTGGAGPLVSHEVVVNLIGGTTTQGGFGHPVGVGRGRLSNRSGGHGRPDGQAVHQTRRVSW